MPALEPLVAIVTGASSGIGRETASQLARRGARVGLLARRREALEELAAELGEGALAIECDVSDPAQVELAVATASDSLGTVNALVNAAGIAEPATLTELDAATWARTIDANLSGTFFPCAAVAKRLRAAGLEGSIVNIGSDLSSMGMPGYTAYCASKTAVIGLTKSLAHELAPRIRVNALCPGPVDTPMLRAEVALAPDPDAALKGEGERVPLGRVSSSGEIAAAAIWLLLDAPFATGGLVPLDGGATAV